MKEVFEMATEKLYGASRGPRTKRYSYVVMCHGMLVLEDYAFVDSL